MLPRHPSTDHFTFDSDVEFPKIDIVDPIVFQLNK